MEILKFTRKYQNLNSHQRFNRPLETLKFSRMKTDSSSTILMNTMTEIIRKSSTQRVKVLFFNKLQCLVRLEKIT